MTYQDIIRDNCKNRSDVSWWPQFAYHYTDVTNAVGILGSGYLYSRVEATQTNVMKNDNASRQVIDMTDSGVVAKVRFYFRPKTPTQYYNEGCKHHKLRFSGDTNANIPVPVFFLFDLATLLSLPGVQFSEKTQAGHGSDMFSGEDAFSRLDFDSIYNDKLEDIVKTKPYRLAEITHPNQMKIEACISHILCRNNLEKTTLLNLLKEENSEAFLKYKDLIKVPKKDVFYNNGLFLVDCVYHDNTIGLTFSDSLESQQYINREMAKHKIQTLDQVRTTVKLYWLDNRNVCYNTAVDFFVDIQNPQMVTLTGLPEIKQATDIRVEVYFEGKLMGCVVHPLKFLEVLT